VWTNTALWISILLSSVAQLLLRKGLAQLRQSNEGMFGTSWTRVFLSLYIWGWGFCFVFAMALWMYALSAVRVSYAVPLLSVSYVLVAVLSAIFLNERVNWARWMAIAVITAGVVLIAID
jgi:drug/metabolite transporter (DMT)-like permease